MPRYVLILIVVAVVALVVSQFLVPAIVERQVEDRLTASGGTADVTVRALPALRLLAGDGDRFEATGRGLAVDVNRPGGDLGRLDDFGEVAVHFTDVSAGPLRVRDFHFDRASGDRPYRVRIAAVTTPRDVASFLGAQAGGALGGLFGDLAAGGLPGGGSTRVPLALTATVESRDGRPEVRGAAGSVAGIPAGPLAQVVVAAVVARI